MVGNFLVLKSKYLPFYHKEQKECLYLHRKYNNLTIQHNQNLRNKIDYLID